MARFEKQYDAEQFLQYMKSGGQYTAGYLAEKVGCTVATAKKLLSNLIVAGKVELVPINDGDSDLLIYKKRQEVI